MKPLINVRAAAKLLLILSIVGPIWDLGSTYLSFRIDFWRAMTAEQNVYLKNLIFQYGLNQAITMQLFREWAIALTLGLTIYLSVRRIMRKETRFRIGISMLIILLLGSLVFAFFGAGVLNTAQLMKWENIP